jgi:hypothetical protein
MVFVQFIERTHLAMVFSDRQFVEVTVPNIFYTLGPNCHVNAAYMSESPRRVMSISATAKKAT